MKYKVLKEEELLTYLLNNLEYSNKKIKALLKYENILVNNKVQTKYNYMLKVGDIVSIKEYKNKKHHINLDVIYEDKNIIVINKEAGLLTIGTEAEKEKTLYHLVSMYVKEENKNNNIFVIHRLDKDTSGIVMFAKNEKIKKLYQDNWNDIVIMRKYVALVEGILNKKEDTIKSYLKENKNNVVYSTKDKTGKLAITNYKVIKEDKNSLLDINIETGRKNQIRVHMKELGHPIIGDKKYGNKGDRLYLHAYKLVIKNPITKKIDTYEIKIPNNFYRVG